MKQPISFVLNHRGRWHQCLIFPFAGVDRIAICTTEITKQVDTEERLKRVLLELVTIQEDERHRISQDLHDDVGQKLTALLFELRVFKDTLEKEQTISISDVDGVIRNLEITIKHVRQVFYQLHPPSLGKVALPKVLGAFCSTFEETSGIQVDYSCQEDFPEVTESYAVGFYRFVQEGLNNVAKHARASSVWINLDYADGDINISLEDNGQGFDVDAVVEGMGLHGIRERFQVLGGSIEIDSKPERGTRLSGVVPFPAHRH